MEMKTSKIGEINLVRLSGDMDSEASATVLQALKPIAKAGGRILLDMEHVEYVSSAHIYMLVQLYRSLYSTPGALAMLHVTDELKRIFDMTGLTPIFPQYASEEEAIAAMSVSNFPEP